VIKPKYIFTALLFFVSTTYVWSEVRTNLEILENEYFSIGRNVLASIHFADTSCVIQKPETPTDYNWVIEKQFVACLKDFGIKHIYGDAQVEDASQLHFKPIEQKIHYQKIAKKKSERQIDLQIYVQFIDSKKRILKDEIISTTFKDSIFSKDLKSIENPQLSFTIGQTERSLLQKIYEPFIVMVATGWIIYLFYSYRSQ